MPRKFTIAVMTIATLWMVALTALTAYDASAERSTQLSHPAPVRVSSL